MADHKKLLLASSAFVVLSLLKTKKREKRFWQATIFKNRHIYSDCTLLRDWKIEHDCGMFQNFFRISPEDFKILLELVEPYIMKSDTNYRKAIPAAKRHCNASTVMRGIRISPSAPNNHEHFPLMYRLPLDHV
nr:unnamed protein product [Callosobruchus analis]